MSLKNVDMENGVSIGPYCNIYGCHIGANTKIGPFTEIQANAHVGTNCKIQSHTFICEGVTIENGVFIGHGVMFCNDKYPLAVDPNGNMITNDWHMEETLIKNNASIGSNSTILCGIIIGENAVVGAGSVVTKDVPDGEVWAGNPARKLR
jgi:acetyltransferase-like isoleucine patch superfamily enzyme